VVVRLCWEGHTEGGGMAIWEVEISAERGRGSGLWDLIIRRDWARLDTVTRWRRGRNQRSV